MHARRVGNAGAARNGRAPYEAGEGSSADAFVVVVGEDQTIYLGDRVEATMLCR
jgi:hypothetical protein